MIDHSQTIVSIWQPKANKWKRQGLTLLEKAILGASLTALIYLLV